MEFDKSRVFTAVNANELEPGSKVILADGFGGLKKAVEADEEVITLKEVLDENKMLRFKAPNDVEYALAYLIEPPEEKKLTKGAILEYIHYCVWYTHKNDLAFHITKPVQENENLLFESAKEFLRELDTDNKVFIKGEE